MSDCINKESTIITTPYSLLPTPYSLLPTPSKRRKCIFPPSSPATMVTSSGATAQQLMALSPVNVA
ncbi:MAG: hypothetical protein F6K51_31255, partial [Moorea sp. SIO3I8]|nr:hypothetical protein [Moorena sp. SIO3I8]